MVDLRLIEKWLALSAALNFRVPETQDLCPVTGRVCFVALRAFQPGVHIMQRRVLELAMLVTAFATAEDVG